MNATSTYARRMTARTGAALLVAVVALTSACAAAHAGESAVETQHPTSSVQVFPDGVDDVRVSMLSRGYTPGQQNPIDIRWVRVAVRAYDVRITVQSRSLADAGDFEAFLDTNADGTPDYVYQAFADGLHRLRVGVDWFDGGDQIKCGARYWQDRDTARIGLILPRSCIGGAGSIRVNVLLANGIASAVDAAPGFQRLTGRVMY